MQWILHHMVNMSGDVDWAESIFDSDSDISSLAESLLEQEEGLSYKRMRRESPQTLRHPYRSVIEWIPEPEEPTPKK